MSASNPRVPAMGRVGRIALVVALVLLVLLVALWLARKPIARRFIDDQLAARHVPARYDLADLGPGRQRLTNVVIGDPKRPDLVADWVETDVAYGTGGISLERVRVGRVRLRGRLVNGRVSLGAIDRLLPAPSGKPFALPSLIADIGDGRMRLVMPQGVVGLSFAGSGRLDDGFSGRIAAVSERLAANGCTAEQVAIAARLSITSARPRLVGPARIGQAVCGTTRVTSARADMHVQLGAALDRWDGRVRLATGKVASPVAQVAGLAGVIGFGGTAADTRGRVELTSSDAAASIGTARRVGMTGDYRIGWINGFAGQLRLGTATAAPSQVARLRLQAPGTPVAPIATALSNAIAAAARDLDGSADVDIDDRGHVRVGRMSLAAKSGARVVLTGGGGLAFDARTRGLQLDTTMVVSGGNFPEGRIALRQASASAPIVGTAVFAPYAAGGARIVLAPIAFRAGPRGETSVSTRATVSGPIGDGRIEDVSLPIDARWSRGALAVNPSCAPLSFRRLAVAGLRLDPATLTLCPTGAALVRADRAGLGGGASIDAVRLTGRLGASPVSLAAGKAAVDLGPRGATIERLKLQLGDGDRLSRLDVARLDAAVKDGTVGGKFAGAGGQIGNVPLILSSAAGGWTLAAGAMKLDGAMVVSDAAATPRFNPLEARNVGLSLVNGAIAASGTLYAPGTDISVAGVTIAHRLSDGRGSADISVPGITFDKDFQPDRLTRLTFGVIADVNATASGTGRIAWTPDGVTSSGVFRTANADLAAAFGPVSGITTEVRFTDLLNLESAPGQVATIKTLNPGIAVNDGRIVFQLYPQGRILVNSGRWPFAGGTLSLDPTLLDFSAPRERRMTFRIDGAAADQFLLQFEFDNLNATGVFDGVLPMIFDESGGRIEGGSIAARPGGGTIAYVGDLSRKKLGFWGDFAFQSLKSLRYRNLTIGMNGPIAGEMVTDVRFAGVSQGEGAKSNFLVRRLQRLPLVFNIRIKAPFRGLLDSVQSFYDPNRLITRNLPALLERQNSQQQNGATTTPKPIQPSASETVP